MKFISIIECFLLISSIVAASPISSTSQLVTRNIESARSVSSRLSKRGNCVGKCATGQSSKASSGSSGGRPGGNRPAGGSTPQSPAPSTPRPQSNSRGRSPTPQSPAPSTPRSQSNSRGRSPTPRTNSNQGSRSPSGGSSAGSRSTQYMSATSSLQGSVSRQGSSSSTTSRASSDQSRNQRNRSPSGGSNASSRSRPAGSPDWSISRQGSGASSSSRASSEIHRLIGPHLPSSRSASPGSSEASSHGVPIAQKPTVEATMKGPGWMRAVKGRDGPNKFSFHTVAKGQEKTKTWSHPDSVHVMMASLNAGKGNSPSLQTGFASGRTALASVMTNADGANKRHGYGTVSSWSPDIGMKRVTTNHPRTPNGHIAGTATRSETNPAAASLSYQGPGLASLSASNAPPRERGYSEFGPRGKKFSLLPGHPESREIQGV